MKVYSAPEHISYVIDYSNYDRKVEVQREQEFVTAVKEWGVGLGYTGKLTGELVYFPVADGHACYMLLDGRRSCLIHMPFGDAWNYRHIEHIPKREIVEQIRRGKTMKAMFS